MVVQAGILKRSVMLKDKWYKDGLRFTCQGCGACCRGPGGYVWTTEEEIERIAARLELPIKQFTRKYIRLISGELAFLDNALGDCIFLDAKGKCEIYDLRPAQCRTFPWWPEIIASRHTWENSGYDCPGIGNGEIVPAEVIEKALKP